MDFLILLLENQNMWEPFDDWISTYEDIPPLTHNYKRVQEYHLSLLISITQQFCDIHNDFLHINYLNSIAQDIYILTPVSAWTLVIYMLHHFRRGCQIMSEPGIIMSSQLCCTNKIDTISSYESSDRSQSVCK